MTDGSPDEAPLDVTAETAGERASEAFSILGSELRLSILLELWEAFEPFTDDNAVPFDELRERVGVDDASQFGYHLEKLTGLYVRETDAGLELRQSGRHIVRTIVAGAGLEEPSLEPTEIGTDCPHCGAPTAATYRDDWLYVVCTECDGSYGTREGLPDGTLYGGAFPPAGTTGRTAGEMVTAQDTKSSMSFLAAAEGVCSTCTGALDVSLHVCEDHPNEGACENCGRRHAIMAQFTCPVCKDYHGTTPSGIVQFHPAVIGFYHDRGVPLQYETDDLASSDRASKLVGDHEQELVSEDPLRVRVTVEYEGDRLHLTLDEELDVVAVEEPD